MLFRQLKNGPAVGKVIPPHLRAEVQLYFAQQPGNLT